ncbi:HlyD family efflux transporter periplasmic adaptor subunit [Kordia sp. YSTF-M3]|uniref:HlyD family efflux transporter periplasmic adaptor subunit n=1 Tax=Kordia aestuariivivens TaxID=2759037 RepID=A0ABR7QGB3_9FLAO|nr:HlyD family efflux transporter periplasmic adaptor subunit [Kordia aestuariivivens]MBC8757607.1 HlyD family efflux transporter periplasmic adaptor subunit [Kordia aestuariivivens]
MAKKEEEKKGKKEEKKEKKAQELRRKINDLDERSDQVKEILGQAPNWVIQWGISVVLIIIVIFIAGSAMLSYNDIIPARVTITSENPPAHLTAKASGKLTSIFVEAGQKVEADQVLAVIENTANFDDVQLLKKKLADFIPNKNDFDSLNDTFPSKLKLGQVQSVYNAFRAQYLTYLNYAIFNEDKNQATNIRLQLSRVRNRLQNSQNQLGFYKTELANSKKRYEKFKRLFANQSVSEREYKDQENLYLSSQRAYEGLLSSIENDRNSILGLQNSLRQASVGDKSSAISTDQNLEQAKQDLENQILQWEQQFLLKSPIKGEVTVFDIWSQYQNVTIGQDLFTVIPDEIQGIIGRVSFPVQNSGKIKIGQSVLIKLDSYPYQEWGSLSGEIINISGVPQLSTQGGPAMYVAYLKVDSLNSSFEKPIDFKQEMEGTAEIVVEELTVMQRIFYQLREVFSRK